MDWLTLAVLSALGLSVANILQKILMKDEKSDPYVYSVVFQFLGALIIGAIAFLNGFVMPPIAELPLNFLLVGVLYGLGTVFIFNALKLIEISEITILSSTRALVTFFSAVLLLGDTFSVTKLIGVALILAAVYLVSKKGKLSFGKGSMFAFGMAVTYGLAVTNDAFILRNKVDTLSYISIAFLIPGLMLVLIRPSSIVKIKNIVLDKTFKRILLMTFIYSMSSIAFYFSLQRGGTASQIGPINQSSVIITVLLATIFLNERGNRKKKIISAVLTFIGILLIK